MTIKPNLRTCRPARGGLSRLGGWAIRWPVTWRGRVIAYGLQPHEAKAQRGPRNRREIGEDAREAAAGAQIVFSCVGKDDDLRGVMLGESGAFAGMTADAIAVTTQPASAKCARELYAQARQRGVHLGCEISGGQAGAVNGQLTVMCGGDRRLSTRAPVAMAFAKAVNWLADPAGPACEWSIACIAGWCKGCPGNWRLDRPPTRHEAQGCK